MRNLRLIAVFSAFGLALAVSGFSQGAPAAPASRPLLRRRLHECLAILDLTEQENTDIQSALAAAKPTLEADLSAVQAARQTLKTALEAASPDACAVGADALALKAARETLRAERQTVFNQVLAILRPDQQTRLQGCVDAPSAGAAGADDSAD